MGRRVSRCRPIKDGQLFARSSFLEPALGSIFRKLALEGYLRDLDGPRFSKRAAHFLAELNAAHPFREGNGRTQREFIRELGLEAGYDIDWRAITRDEMTEASRVSLVTGDEALFDRLLRSCMRART